VPSLCCTYRQSVQIWMKQKYSNSMHLIQLHMFLPMSVWSCAISAGVPSNLSSGLQMTTEQHCDAGHIRDASVWQAPHARPCCVVRSMAVSV
jgi:hypothetical protein